jgi:hypothetical protein
LQTFATGSGSDWDETRVFLDKLYTLGALFGVKVWMTRGS